MIGRDGRALYISGTSTLDTAEREQHLRKVGLFTEVLDDSHMAALTAKATHATYPEGAVLMSRGDFGVAMYVVTAGEVDVHLTTGEDNRRHVATLGPGEIVGEMSLLTGARRNATVTARAPVEALEIGKVALEAILARTPELVDRFGAELAERQAELDRIAAESHETGDVAARIRTFFGHILGR